MVDAGGRRGHPGLRGQPRPPGLRRRPGGRVRRPDGRRAVHRRRHPHHGRRDPGGRRRASCAPPCARLRAEALRQGTTTIEIKSGYGLTVADEARSCGSPASSPPRRRSSARTSCRPSTPAAPTTTWRWCAGAMLDGRRAVRPLGRRVLRAGRLRRRPGPRRARAPGSRAGLLPRVHANQLGAGPRRAARRRAGAASADHCTHLPTRTSTRSAGSSHRGHAAARGRVLDPVALPGRAPAARRRASRVALATDCNPGSSYTIVDAVLHRPRRPRDAA